VVRQGYILLVFSPFEMLAVLIHRHITACSLHKKPISGRASAVYAIATTTPSRDVQRIRVQRVKFILFPAETGLMSGVAAICLNSRLGFTRPSIATGMSWKVAPWSCSAASIFLGGSGSIPRRGDRGVCDGGLVTSGWAC